MKDIYQEALEMHEKVKGKLEVQLKVPLNESHDLSLAYTPGVAQPCREIAKIKKMFINTLGNKTVLQS